MSEGFNYVVCKHCGQSFIPHIELTSEAAAELYALEQCDCDAAIEELRKTINLKKLENVITEFEGYCAARETVLTDEVKALIQHVGKMILFEQIGATSMKLENINIKISLNSNLNIVVSFTYKDSKKSEVV